jgi:hypothetical protein
MQRKIVPDSAPPATSSAGFNYWRGNHRERKDRAAEVAGSLRVIFGVLTQLAAARLILLILGAIQKKIFVWHTGFWDESGTNGWKLRHDACHNESRDRHDRRWKPFSDEMSVAEQKISEEEAFQVGLEQKSERVHRKRVCRLRQSIAETRASKCFCE